MTILFVILPITSHYLTAFSLAHTYKNLGYRIIFTGQEYHRDLVEKEGFIFYEIEYTTQYIIKSFKLFISLLIKSVLNSKDCKYRYKEWLKSVQMFRHLVTIVNPNVVFLDEHLNYYYLYIYNYKNKTIILNTKLSTKRRKNIPPLNSNYIPNKTFFSQTLSDFLWEKHLFRRNLKEAIYDLAFLGYTENYFLTRLMNQANIKFDSVFSKNNSFYDSLNEITSIVLAPKSLEFDEFYDVKNEYYFNLPITRTEVVLDDDYLNLKKSINKEGYTRAIYASFGTQVFDNANVIINFLPELIKVFISQPKWILILSIPDAFIKNNFKNISNIKIYSQVPQLDILTWCDAMITHGGLNSVKECLQAGIPMLVYPLNSRMDMIGNGARLTAKGWGTMGDLQNDKFENILKKIQKILKLKPVIPPFDYSKFNEFIGNINS